MSISLGICAPLMAGHCSVGDRDAEGRDWTTTPISLPRHHKPQIQLPGKALVLPSNTAPRAPRPAGCCSVGPGPDTELSIQKTDAANADANGPRSVLPPVCLRPHIPCIQSGCVSMTFQV